MATKIKTRRYSESDLVTHGVPDDHEYIAEYDSIFWGSGKTFMACKKAAKEGLAAVGMDNIEEYLAQMGYYKIARVALCTREKPGGDLTILSGNVVALLSSYPLTDRDRLTLGQWLDHLIHWGTLTPGDKTRVVANRSTVAELIEKYMPDNREK